MRLKSLLTTSLLYPLFLTGCPGDDVTADTDTDDGTSTGGMTTMQPTTMQPTTMTTMADTTEGMDGSTTSDEADTTVGEESTTAVVDDSTSTGPGDESSSSDGGSSSSDGGSSSSDGGSSSSDGGSSSSDGGSSSSDGGSSSSDGGSSSSDGGSSSSDGGSSSSTDGGSTTTGGVAMPEVFCTSPAAAIGPALGTETISTINVMTLDGFVGDVNVTVDAAHTFAADMDIFITHVPTGTVVELVTDVCVGGDDFDVRFDQQGDPLTCLTGSVPVLAGDMIPEGDLGAFNGIADGTGDWELSITDDANGDGGTLNEWCIELTPVAADPVVCGDGEISFGEECDGIDLAGQDCTDAGMFDGGNLACDPVDCTLDVSDCSVCGDMIVNGNEDCDTGDLDGGTCVSQGFADGGMLACDDASCTYDVDMCMGIQCGDSVIDMGEVCDTNELAGNTCEDEGFTGGSLDCMPLACGFDTSECSNNVIAVCSGDMLGLAISDAAPLVDTQSPMDMGTVGDVDVYVDLVHTFDGDIDMQLRHVASDTTVDLVFDDCGTQEDMQAYFNDEGNGSADCVLPIAIEGNLTPETPLSAIDGELIASDWELIITDDAAGDNGTLNSWCLYITAE